MNELLNLLNLLNLQHETINAYATVVIALCTVIELSHSRKGNVVSDVSKPILRMEDDDHWKD